MSSTVFQMDLSGRPAAADVLGIWLTLPAQSYAIEGPAAEDTTLWRIDLPVDREQAIAVLNRQQAYLSLAEQDLPRAAQKLNKFLQLNSQAGQAASFDLASTEGQVNDADRQLARWLGALSGAESFAPGVGWLAEWEETNLRAQAFFEQVRRSLTSFAWVETLAGGKTLGRTSVSWRGDFETLWLIRLAPEQASQHEQCVRMALVSRTAWLHISMLVARSAVQLALMASTAPYLVLPAALKYIQQILAQYREMRATLQPNQ